MTDRLSTWLPDFGVSAISFAFISIFSGAVAIILAKDLVHNLISSKVSSTRSVIACLGWTAIAGFFGYALYSNTRRAHWLRVGTARYTVATVTRSYYSRSGRKFAFVYRVGPYQGKSQQDCGEAGCPPVGSRRYMRFAAEAPDVSELTRWDVPDTLQTVPPLGWAQIP